MEVIPLTLNILTADVAMALVQDGMPAIRRFGRETTATIPDEVLALVAGLTLGQYVPLAIEALDMEDVERALKQKNECVAVITSWNRISTRDKNGFVFHLRTNVEDGQKSVTLYGGLPNAEAVNNDTDVMESSDSE
jgi:hypothetical protein